jgi:predicted small secreted protein
MNTLLKLTLTAITLITLTACNTNNGKGKQNSAHGLINVPPIAQSQTIKLNEDTQTPITLKATDEDGDTIGYRISLPPKHGTLKGKAPNITYIPNKDYNGEDTFAFIANDGQADSKEAVITLDINPINDKPTARDDKAKLDEDTQITIDPLSNDSDVDIATNQDKLTITNITQPKNGKAKIKENTIIYTPNPNFNGSDSITYTIEDKAKASTTAKIDIAINPVNDAPIAKDDNITIKQNEQKKIYVLDNDTDVDTKTNGDVIKTDKISIQPKHGKAIVKNNTIVYTPNKDYTGNDVLEYAISDKHNATSKAKLYITVRELTDSEKYKQLEENGIVPKLDRSDDIAGPDNDHNGIRDDVDEYIDSHYTDVKRRKAAQQLARMYQDMLTVDKSDRDKAKEISRRGMLAIHCGNSVDVGLYDTIKPLVLNTRKRVKEFYKYDSLLDGTTTTLPEGDTCEK